MPLSPDCLVAVAAGLVVGCARTRRHRSRLVLPLHIPVTPAHDSPGSARRPGARSARRADRPAEREFRRATGELRGRTARRRAPALRPRDRSAARGPGGADAIRASRSPSSDCSIASARSKCWRCARATASPKRSPSRPPSTSCSAPRCSSAAAAAATTAETVAADLAANAARHLPIPANDGAVVHRAVPGPAARFHARRVSSAACSTCR